MCVFLRGARTRDRVGFGIDFPAMARDGEHNAGWGESGSGRRVRCVVLHPPGSSVPTALGRALSQRSIEVRATDEAFEAMAWLMRWGRSAGEGPAALLVVRGEACVEAQALTQAAERYVPRAVCWVYDPERNEPLRALGAGDVARWAGPSTRAPAERVPASPGSRAAPSLRLAGTDPGAGDRKTGSEIAHSGDDPASEGEPSGLSGRTLLTDEELAMLLADDDEGLSGAR